MSTLPVIKLPSTAPWNEPSIPQAVAENARITRVSCWEKLAEGGDPAESAGLSDRYVPVQVPLTLAFEFPIGGDVTLLFESLHPNAAIARVATATPIRIDRRSGSRMTDTPFVTSLTTGDRDGRKNFPNTHFGGAKRLLERAGSFT